MASIARATREDRRVDVGSPRGTQRLFETARAAAVVAGREFVTPDDVRRGAGARPSARVDTPDAAVNDTDKQDVIADVLDRIAVPTVDAAEA